MNNCYWIIKLRVPLVFQLWKAKKHTGLKQVAYIESSRAARFMLKLLRACGILTITLQEIEGRRGPSGPKLNLSSVRNDKGEVIIFELYHQVLDLRRKIVSRMMDSIKHLFFFKDKENPDMIGAYFGIKIAEEITPAVYMANYIRLQGNGDNNNSGNNQGEKTRHILVVPGTPWDPVLVPHLENLVHEVRVDKKAQGRLKLFSRVVKHVFRAVQKAGLFKSLKYLRTPLTEINTSFFYDQSIPGKIMVAYRIGLLADRRNDIAFYHASDISPERLLVFCKTQNHLPFPEEMEWLKRSGIECLAAPVIEQIPGGARRWQPSPLLKQELKKFYLVYIKTTAQGLRIKKRNWWLLDKLWTLGVEIAFWKDFYWTNHIRILVNSIPSDTNFIPNIALAEAGGLAVELERSIRFDYCTYIHNSPNHIYFATGPYSLEQIPEASFSPFTIQTGGINISDNHVAISGLAQLRENSQLLITLFDEIPTDWFFGESVDELYRSIIRLVMTDHRLALLIKTKKPRVFEKLSDADDIDTGLANLVQKGRCLMLDWKITPYAAASYSDLVVSVASTAAFESILAGVRTIIYNPQRSGSKIFYRNNALNRRIFEDSGLMIDAITAFANGQNNSIGDCSDILPLIDPYSDGKGAGRMGQYLQWCLEGFDAGLEWETVLGKANERYAQQWGPDKVTSNKHE